MGHIFHATVNRIAKVEDDYHEMMELKKRAEAADVAKSRVFHFLTVVSLKQYTTVIQMDIIELFFQCSFLLRFPMKSELQ